MHVLVLGVQRGERKVTFVSIDHEAGRGNAAEIDLIVEPLQHRLGHLSTAGNDVSNAHRGEKRPDMVARPRQELVQNGVDVAVTVTLRIASDIERARSALRCDRVLQGVGLPALEHR
jgi:hypothetical protein